MNQPFDFRTLPMQEEISALAKVEKVARALHREDLEILEAAKFIQLRRIADALDRLAPPPKPITPSDAAPVTPSDDPDQWDYHDFDPSDDPE
jgi:hypothetical protein